MHNVLMHMRDLIIFRADDFWCKCHSFGTARRYQNTQYEHILKLNKPGSTLKLASKPNLWPCYRSSILFTRYGFVAYLSQIVMSTLSVFFFFTYKVNLVRFQKCERYKTFSSTYTDVLQLCEFANYTVCSIRICSIHSLFNTHFFRGVDPHQPNWMALTPNLLPSNFSWVRAVTFPQVTCSNLDEV